MEMTLATGYAPKGAMVMEAELVSRIPDLVRQRGWTEREFIGRCIIAGTSADTAKRLLRGSTSATTRTLAQIAKVFAVQSISELMDLPPGES
jgi:transcriptional regulator with XRE-family HTH domain